MRLTYPGDYINKIICGDCIEVMKAMKPNSVDAIVTDPPYGLEFMGKEWDKLWDKRKPKENKEGYVSSDGCIRKTNPVTVKLNLPNYQAGMPMQLWHTQWLTEAYRVLKPGGSMLVMGGTRTSHRLACAIEDSGFIIKDTLMWLYGSGFPKAQEVSVLVDAKILGISTKEVNEKRRKGQLRTDGRGKWDLKMDRQKGDTGIGHADGSHQAYYETFPLTPEGKHWNGFKVGGIKPAYEPIIWAVKPPEGSYVDNVLKWGVGAVNVDECRVGTDNFLGRPQAKKQNGFMKMGLKDNEFNDNSTGKGRFPSNVILSHHPECVQVGMKKVRGSQLDHNCSRKETSQIPFTSKGSSQHRKGYTDPDGYEQVESWNCHPDCAVRILDEQSGVSKSSPVGFKNVGWKHSGNKKEEMTKLKWQQEFGDSGGASRFFYCAKASKSERGKNNKHPTVKPIALFMWLIQLVTREEQIILDPFIGSGTTMLASQGCNRKCVGIEKDKDYCKIAEERLAQGVL